MPLRRSVFRCFCCRSDCINNAEQWTGSCVLCSCQHPTTNALSCSLNRSFESIPVKGYLCTSILCSLTWKPPCKDLCAGSSAPKHRVVTYAFGSATHSLLPQAILVPASTTALKHAQQESGLCIMCSCRYPTSCAGLFSCLHCHRHHCYLHLWKLCVNVGITGACIDTSLCCRRQ